MEKTVCEVKCPKCGWMHIRADEYTWCGVKGGMVPIGGWCNGCNTRLSWADVFGRQHPEGPRRCIPPSHPEFNKEDKP